MNKSDLGIALISYLTGLVAVYAYRNKNPYFDLVIAAIAIFIFGTAMLLRSFGLFFGAAHFLTILSSGFMFFAVLFLMGRLAGKASSAIAKYFELAKSKKHKDPGNDI